LTAAANLVRVRVGKCTPTKGATTTRSSRRLRPTSATVVAWTAHGGCEPGHLEYRRQRGARDRWRRRRNVLESIGRAASSQRGARCAGRSSRHVRGARGRRYGEFGRTPESILHDDRCIAHWLFAIRDYYLAER